MKYVYVFLSLFLGLTIASQKAWGGDFTSGNLVVLRVGSGSPSLSSNTAPVFLDEFTIAGASVQTITVPSSSTGRVTISGSATSEGLMTRSTDGRFLVFGGYDADAATASVVTGTSATFNRIVARVDYQANIDVTTKLTDAYDGSNIRSAASIDGTAFWTGGNGGSGLGATAGTRYSLLGATTSIGLHATTTNIRAVGIFNGQLYSSAASGTVLGVVTVGTGVPTTAAQTITELPGFPTTGTHSSYGFSINPTSDVAYVADDGAFGSGGGIQKWTFAASTWTLAYTLLNTGAATTAVRGLLVDWSGGNPVIYATTTTASANALIKVVDAGSGSTATTLATAPASTAFRDVAFAPLQVALPVELTSFTGSARNGRIELNWNTATEVNNYGFEIQRKIHSGLNGLMDWQKIGFVDGHGTTNAPQNYSYIDNAVAFGKYSYRLKQIDRDGKFSYSKTVESVVGVAPNAMILGQNYPNPFNPETNIEFVVPVSGRTTLKVYSMLGQEVATLVNGNIEAGVIQHASFKGTSLPSGLYFYTLRSGSFVDTKKMLMMK